MEDAVIEQSKAAMRGRKARKVNVGRMICGNVRVRGIRIWKSLDSMIRRYNERI